MRAGENVEFNDVEVALNFMKGVVGLAQLSGISPTDYVTACKLLSEAASQTHEEIFGDGGTP